MALTVLSTALLYYFFYFGILGIDYITALGTRLIADQAYSRFFFAETKFRPAVVATPIGRATSRTSTTLAPPEFKLVSFDKLGNRQPLPLGLGDLPLHPDDDGFSSVNGPPLRLLVAHIARDNHSAIYPSIAEPPGSPGENPCVTPNRRQYNSNNDAISRFFYTSPSNPHPPTLPLVRSP